MVLLIGKRFSIHREPASSGAEGERVPILLAPGRAFGSGEHETTRSCIEELESLKIPPRARALDLGCGTGILSIAAVKLGAEAVVAIDPDPNAVRAAAATVRLNDALEKVSLVQGKLEALRGTSFDLIMANLHGDILLGIADRMAALLGPEGLMLLSGVQYEYAYDVKAAIAKCGCALLRSRYLEDYVTCVFRKSSSGKRL